jgi:predicted amidohydrolase
MTICCCQLDIAWENKPANHAKVTDLLTQASSPQGSLVLLPEMFATGFSMGISEITDSHTRETQSFLAQLAARQGIYLLAGIVSSAPDGRGYNEAVLFSPDGRESTRYRKIHPFSFGRESQYYTGGQQIVTFPWAGFTVCPFVCYDLRFPEIFRCAVRRGVNLFAIIANWPASREHHWLTLLQARAIENQAYVAAVNRCGNDPTLTYAGRSVIIDPRGRIIADAGNAQGTIRAALDLESLQNYRAEFPALQDIHGQFLPPCPPS